MNALWFVVWFGLYRKLRPTQLWVELSCVVTIFYFRHLEIRLLHISFHLLSYACLDIAHILQWIQKNPVAPQDKNISFANENSNINYVSTA